MNIIEKQNVTGVWAMQHSREGRNKESTGHISFKNGDVSAEKHFKASTTVDVIQQMNEFLKTLK